MILSLEQQVAPLALCQRLNEMGAPQDTEFVWGIASNPGVEVLWGNDRDIRRIDCAAYTVAELGELMPKDERWWSSIEWHQDGTPVWESGYGSLADDIFIGDMDTEAEARAELLIVLAERGVVKWERA